MMNEIQIFTHEKFGEIRTVEIDGEIYFVGRDIARALSYKKPENALAEHVDKEDKKTITLNQGNGSNYKSRTTVINESGLYSLILASKLKGAKEFKHWVTSEVLLISRKIKKHKVLDIQETLCYNGYSVNKFQVINTNIKRFTLDILTFIMFIIA